MSTVIELECSFCREIFTKQKKEHTRQRKKNPQAKFYCSLSCAAKENNKNPSEKMIKNRQNLRNFRGNHRKKKSVFETYFMRKIKTRHWAYDIDHMYLQSLWENQSGKCAISSIPMVLPEPHKKYIGYPHTASLDRIDSNKGYLKGNVQFICRSLNLGKSTFNEEEFREFISKISSSAHLQLS